MKTNKIFMLAIAAGAMFLGSCSNDDELKQIEESAKPATMVFTATMENAGDATRTVLGGDSCTDVYWSSGDAITIFNSANTEGAVFTTSADDTVSCTFSGSIDSTTPYYAVYPAQISATLSGTAINGVTLPAEQTAVAGSYDPAAALMVATSSTTDLPFKNLNTLIKVTPKFDCTKIIFDAGTTQIAGKVNVTPGETPTWAATSTTEDAKSVVTLSGIIQADSTYYIAILPTTTTFTITFCAVESDTTGNLGFKKEKSTSYPFARNKIVNLGNFGKNDLTAYKYAGQPDVNKPIVDLGLSVCWAKYNVGYVEETKPYGDYFAWGETEPYYVSYTGGTAVTATFTGDSAYTQTYYQLQSAYSIGADLTSANDAATQKMEGTEKTAWHTPTLTEVEELRQNTVWVYGSQEYGGVSSVNGYKVFRAIDDAYKGYIYMYDSGTDGYKWFKVNDESTTYKPSGTGSQIPDIVTDTATLTILNNAYKGKTAPLFLPTSGLLNGTKFYNGGSIGYYWSSTWSSNYNANYLLFDRDKVHPHYIDRRWFGRTVRGVCE